MDPGVLGLFLLMIIYGEANGYQCSERPRKLGCFEDRGNKRLMTWAFSVKMKGASDWVGDKWDEHLDKLLCKCSEEAKKGGYMYFGLQHYYECWVGNLNSAPDLESSRLKDTSKCWSKNPNPLRCIEAEPTCVGISLTMAIYEVIYSSHIITDTEEPTVKAMTLPNKGQRPPPKIPAPPQWHQG